LAGFGIEMPFAAVMNRPVLHSLPVNKALTDRNPVMSLGNIPIQPGIIAKEAYRVEDSSGEVTRLLIELKGRRHEAAARLFDLLYVELRRLARRHLLNERPEHTLQATALVHEAYLRLVDGHQDWQNRAHFFAVASSAMRRILVDHARAKRAAKRPGSQKQSNPDDLPPLAIEHYDDVIEIDLALLKLSKLDARQSRIVELRYFGGLTAEEAAEALAVSVITVQRDWAVAKAWLHGELAGRAGAP
jgi:RNA polymerase sigma-70 factor (ECF subfamily)